MAQHLRSLIWPEDAPAAHKDYIARLKAYTKDEYGSSWAIMGYIAMQCLVEGIKKANSTDTDKVAKAMLGMTFDTPIGPADDPCEGPPGQPRPILGQDGQGSEVPVRDHEADHPRILTPPPFMN